MAEENNDVEEKRAEQELGLDEFSQGGFNQSNDKELNDFRTTGSQWIADEKMKVSPVREMNVMGAPFLFMNRTDPDGRVYNNTFAVDAPIISLMPGEPLFLSLSAKDIDGREEISSDSSIMEKLLSNMGLGTPDSIINWLTKVNFKKNLDMRYYGFKANYSEYYKYLQNMMSVVHVKMGLGTVFQFSDVFTSGKSSLNYYVNKDYSVSEGLSNTYGESSLSGMAKAPSQMMRELRFITGQNLSASELSSMQGETQDSEIKNNVDEILNGGWMSKIMMRGGVDKTKTVMNGSNLVYPEVWNDSSFTRTISFNMNLFSPYGDPQSIFQYVYGPFMSLLALTLPRHDTLMGYNAPFLVKADCPGNFTCDMGVIDQLSYKKGGAEDMWTRDGLPNAIDVSVSVKDLYNVMMMDKSFSMLSSNISMATYLDNMSGIGITDWTISENIQAWFASKVNYITGIDDRIANKTNDFIEAFQSASNGLAKFLP